MHDLRLQLAGEVQALPQLEDTRRERDRASSQHTWHSMDTSIPGGKVGGHIAVQKEELMPINELLITSLLERNMRNAAHNDSICTHYVNELPHRLPSTPPKQASL